MIAVYESSSSPHYAVLLASLLYLVLTVESMSVDPSKSLVYGPGLDANAQLPTRYVLVELHDRDGNRLVSSAGDLDVGLTLPDGSGFRGQVRVIDRKDGSYVINYRPVMSMKDVEFSIQHNKVHLANSPYLIKGWMYQENCNCPNQNTAQWINALQCPESFGQLEDDLSQFSQLDMRFVESEVHRKWPKKQGQGALMHYVVKDGRVYRKEVGTICGFKMFSDAILLSLIRKVKLPDVEFFINLGDWPLVQEGFKHIPVFSWCGSNTTRDIILPTYDITDSTMKSLSQVSLDILSAQGPADNPVWADKLPRAVFRGRDSRKERLELVQLSKKGDNSKLIDAGITAFFFFPKDDSLSAERINFFDFFKYKYQLNIDGTVAAYRFPYLMVSNTLVFKQDSPYYEHFYRDLQPWVHYIPVNGDLSNVLEQIKWAKKHDKQAESISLAGSAKARQLLTPANTYCYYYRAFQKFAERIKSKVEVQEGMEEAVHPDYMAGCSCHRSEDRTSRDEL